MAQETPQVLSLDQKRAAYAWTCVNVARQELGKDYKDFVSLVKSAPALIMNNGLMQFLAFCRSKLDDKVPEKEKRYRLLLLAVLAWLMFLEKDIEKAHEAMTQFKRMKIENQKRSYQFIMEKLHNSSSFEYRQKTREALELAKWLKQQADALKSFATMEE